MNKSYSYYGSVKNKTDSMFYELNFEQYMTSKEIMLIDIYKQKFYNLILNLCNQLIYNSYYTLTKDDLLFIEKFEIDKKFDYILEKLKEDVLKMINISKLDEKNNI